MKKVLSLFLAFVFVVGICISAPITITANAASVDDLVFELNEDGVSYSVTGCYGNAAGEMVVPSTYQGLPVTKIGNGAFDDAKSVTSFVLPDTIIEIGKNAFYGCGYYNKSSNWENDLLYIGKYLVAAKNTISGNCEIKKGTKCISDEAFAYCNSLVSVSIPDGVEVISNGLFRGCKSLVSVLLPKTGVKRLGDFAFEYCDKLSDLVIPDGVIEIGDKVFYGDSCFEKVSLPDSIRIIGMDAFTGTGYSNNENNWDGVVLYIDNHLIDTQVSSEETSCFIKEGTISIAAYAFEYSYYKDVQFPKSLKSICEGAFRKSEISKADLNSGVEIIDNMAFDDCDNLSYVILPETLTKLGSFAFYYCEKLEEVKMPDSFIEPCCFMESCFQYCSLINNILLPDGLVYIGDKAFANCSVLQSISIPKTVEFIGDNAFSWSYLLNEINIPDSVKQIGVDSFRYTGFSENSKNYEDGLLYINNHLVDAKLESIKSDVVIKPGTKTVAERVFYDSERIISVDVPGSVSVIPEGLFSGCLKLQRVTLNPGVKYIEKYAFISCDNLEYMYIPKTIEKIDGWAFSFSDKKLTVDYQGTKESWDCIFIGDNNESLINSEKTFLGNKIDTPEVQFKNTAKGISVSWNAIENAESYIVYRSVYNASTKKWSKWASIKSGVTDVNYTDTTVKLGTSYKYTVRAVNGESLSNYQNTKNGLKYDVTPTVKVAVVSNGVKVSWSTAANATGYTVYRSQYNTSTKKWSGWKNMGTAKADKTSWTDKSVKSGVQYKYTVRAANGKVLSSYNKSGVATIFLAQPTVKIANNAKGVKVAWSKVSGATGYTVYRSEYKNGEWTKWASRGTAKANNSSWVDTKVTSGVQYKYTVRAINGKYKSTYVSSSALLYLAQPVTTVKAVSNGVNVAWTQSEGALGYTVYRSEYNTKTKKWSSWKNMGTAKAEKTNWTDKKAKKGVTYKYTVKAVNGKTASTYKASGTVKR